MEKESKITNKLDSKKIIKHLEKIISIPSPTGNTKKVTDFIIEFAKYNGIEYELTNKGSVIFKFGNIKNDKIKQDIKGICFAAHVDTLGLMVKSVSNDVIKVTAVGGIPPIYAIGDYVTIEASDGEIYYGTVLPENPAAHVNKKIYELVPNYDDSFIRLDFDFSKYNEISNEEEKEKKIKKDDNLKNHIQVGDYVFLDPKFQYINGFIKTRFLDDKASCSIFLHIAEILMDFQKNDKINFTKPIYMYFNVTEETGQGIANLPEIEELYIVDMGVVGSGVEGNEFAVSICPKDSSGPYNFELTKKLERLAKENNIKYAKDLFPYYGSDGSAALRAGADIKVALFGVGVSASHGYERTHEIGLLNTAKLMSLLIEEVIY